MSEALLDPEALRALGICLCEARQSRGWTQEQLADYSGLAPTTIVAIERGEQVSRHRILSRSLLS
jgi:transcriptional regulator with XRE-family HTH domain